MSDASEKFTLQTVTSVHHWTDRLLSFRCSRDRGFRFNAGQFARVGMDDDAGVRVWRPFSMVSAPYDEFLEFLAIQVPGGDFSRRLATLRVGSTLAIDRTSFGFLTLDRFSDGADLWLLATGTGLAPFISILQTSEAWTRFNTIVLVHSVRTEAELAYRDTILQLDQHPLVGEWAQRLRYVPLVTRGDAIATRSPRIPALLASGELEQRAGCALSVADSRIMICGNPEMVRDTLRQLKSMGFALARREQPGQLAIENAF
jgi:ferredoxin--NADP+ reductase